MTKTYERIYMKNKIKNILTYGLGTTLLLALTFSQNITQNVSAIDPETIETKTSQLSPSKGKENPGKKVILHSQSPVVSKVEEISDKNDWKELLKAEPIPFETRIVEDTLLPNGIEVIDQKGKDGQKLFFVAHEKVVSLQGKIESADINWEEEIKPVDQIVRKGTNSKVISGVHPLVVEKENEIARQKEEKAKKEAESKNASPSTEIPKWTGGGDKESWMRAAGIPEDQWGYVDFIVNRESSWNPNALNASSGACGLGQFLPCSKVTGGSWNDPVVSLKFQKSYVEDRYGSYKNAYAFWQANSWY